MSDIVSAALIVAVAAGAIVTIWVFSKPKGRPVSAIMHLKELHIERLRVLEANGEVFNINECKVCEERWPCTTKVLLDWVDKECR